MRFLLLLFIALSLNAETTSRVSPADLEKMTNTELCCDAISQPGATISTSNGSLKNSGEISLPSVALAANPGITLSNCTTPWGATVLYGNSVTAYGVATSATASGCVSETRTCGPAGLSGGYTNQNCRYNALAAFEQRIGGCSATLVGPQTIGSAPYQTFLNADGSVTSNNTILFKTYGSYYELCGAAYNPLTTGCGSGAASNCVSFKYTGLGLCSSGGTLSGTSCILQ